MTFSELQEAFAIKNGYVGWHQIEDDHELDVVCNDFAKFCIAAQSGIMAEKEIQARIEFKFNEMIEAFTNAAKSALSAGDMRGHDAFIQAAETTRKEMQIQVPYDSMSERKRVSKKTKAVDSIMEHLAKEGDRNYSQKREIVAKEVEGAQFW